MGAILTVYTWLGISRGCLSYAPYTFFGMPWLPMVCSSASSQLMCVQSNSTLTGDGMGTGFDVKMLMNNVAIMLKSSQNLYSQANKDPLHASVMASL